MRYESWVAGWDACICCRIIIVLLFSIKLFYLVVIRYLYIPIILLAVTNVSDENKNNYVNIIENYSI